MFAKKRPTPVDAEHWDSPRGEYNSTRYPPDRINPRRKTTRRITNTGEKLIMREN